MIVSEFLSAMTTGSFILIAVICVGGGALVGAGVRSMTGRVVWTLAIFLGVFVLLLLSGHMRSLADASAAGVLPRNFFSDFLIFTLAVFASIYGVALWIIAHGNAVQDAEMVAAVAALGPNEFVQELSVIAAHPAMSAGWFTDRWAPMNQASRRSWVETHIESLRDLRLQGGEQGLAAFGLDLPMHLAALDQRSGPGIG